MTPKTTRHAKIDVVIADPTWSKILPKAVPLGRQAARLALRASPVGRPTKSGRPIELALCLANDRTIRRLNKDYRGKDKTTNVLSFPVSADSAAGTLCGQRRHLGDVVLALGTLQREAKRQKKTLSAHYCHLVAHGVLHLLGFDHQTGAAAELMEEWEKLVLAELGHKDPYR